MEPLTLFLTILAGFLAIGYFIFGSFRRFEKQGILHLKPRLIFGNLAPALFRKRPFVDVITSAYELSDEADYVGFYDFSNPVIIARSPQLIKNIAIKHFDHFVDHRGFVTAEQDPLFGKNLFSLRGEKWKEMRSLLTPTFTSSKMKGMFKLMSDCAENFANYMAESAEKEPRAMDVKDAFTRYANDVIATCAFGVCVDSMRNPENEFYTVGRKSTKIEGMLTLRFFLLSAFPRFSKLLNIPLIDRIAAQFFENIISEAIEKRDREGTSRPDMIQLMMETRGNRTGPSLTVQEMAAQAFGFFFAGFDTSSALMCFLAHEMAVNEDIQKRLQDEIDRVLDETKGVVTYEAVNGMLYLDAVIHEGLRKYPGGPFQDRQCVKSFELPPPRPGGKPVVIEPGSIVWFPIFAIHRDSKYYPEPEKFDPERFMPERKKDIDPFTFFPFGQGPRMCVGYRFALLETKVLFFNLLAKCNIRRCSKTVEPIKLSKESFGVSAEGGFWVRFETRNKSREKNGECCRRTSDKSS